MSFVVQVWAQPPGAALPCDGFEADAQRLLLRQSGESGPLAFVQLQQALQQRFEVPEADPLWNQSLDNFDVQEPVLDIGLLHDSPRFEAALNFLIAESARLGLHLSDSVSGVVHLADGSVIGEADEVLVFAAPDLHPSPTLARRSSFEEDDKISVYPDIPDSDEPAPPVLHEGFTASGWARHIAPASAGAVVEASAQQAVGHAAGNVDHLRREAESGNPRAAYELGLSLQEPASGEPDRSQAVYWFQRGAEAGDAWAAAMLGACLLEGQGTARDTVRARHWLERAQSAGSSSAQFQLGRMLVAGWGGPAEPERGVRLYLLAAAQGHADAIFNLASCLDAGYGCDQDRIAAKALFLRARAMGSPLRATGLRVKKREIEAVRALARRFEVSADIPTLIEERRTEKSLVRTLQRKPKGAAAAAAGPVAPAPLDAAPPAPLVSSGLHAGHLALIFSGLGMPLVLLLMSEVDQLALFGTLAALALLGGWGAWRIAMAWRPGRRGVLAALAAVPGLGLIIAAVLLLRFGRRLNWPQTDPSQTRQG